MSRWRRIVLATLLATTVPPLAAAQEMLRYFDLKSDEFTKADMTRIEVEAVLAAANPARPADLSARRLNGLICRGSTSDARSSRRRASMAPTLPAPISMAPRSIRLGHSMPISPAPRCAAQVCLPRS